MKTQVTASKFMSFVLRHQPEEVGVALDAGGGARIEELVERSKGVLTTALLRQIVAESDKQRFAISTDGQRIRANQGHSIAVDLRLEPRDPPDKLFHGTASRFLPDVLKHGLKRMSRNHVHLSTDTKTARSVGQRYGEPVILRIDARAMRTDGCVFFRSDNGVWLTEAVPSTHITQEDP